MPVVPVISNFPVSATAPLAVTPRFPPTVVAPKLVPAAVVVRSPVALPDTPKVPTAVRSVVPVVFNTATRLSASFKVVAPAATVTVPPNSLVESSKVTV